MARTVNKELVSKEELMANGWPSRLVDEALDLPDETGPSGHWLNTHGKPYYLRERVEIAWYRMGRTDTAPDPAAWAR